MNHNRHAYLMIGLIAVGAVLFLTDAIDGGVLFLLGPLVCLVMMVVVMRAMSGTKAAPNAPTTV